MTGKSLVRRSAILGAVVCCAGAGFAAPARHAATRRAAPARAPAPKLAFVRGVPIGTTATSASGDFRLTLLARKQHYLARTRDAADQYDADIFSPKSVRFHPDGRKVYVNAMESNATVVYDAVTLDKTAVIRHRFGAGDATLFSGEAAFDYRFPRPVPRTGADRFSAKPVEMEFTHGGRYLWVSYYRRDFDRDALGPSAVAVVDTATDRIVRVVPAGPIPKYLAAAPGGDRLAMIHWGDNTVGFVDIRSSEPRDFRLADLVEVGRRLDLGRLARSGKKLDRDKVCGACLRGAVFTADGRWLLVAKLSGGGIAVLDTSRPSASVYVGTAWGMRPTPRHLVLRGDRLYVGSNVGGYVSWFKVDEVIAAAEARRPATARAEAHLGYGVRTIAVSPDGRWVYAAVNGAAKLMVLRAGDLSRVAEIAVDSYPVGLAVSPDGARIWVTSQGRSRQGGNSVCIYAVDAAPAADPPAPVSR